MVFFSDAFDIEGALNGCSTKEEWKTFTSIIAPQ